MIGASAVPIAFKIPGLALMNFPLATLITLPATMVSVAGTPSCWLDRHVARQVNRQTVEIPRAIGGDRSTGELHVVAAYVANGSVTLS